MRVWLVSVNYRYCFAAVLIIWKLCCCGYEMCLTTLAQKIQVFTDCLKKKSYVNISNLVVHNLLKNDVRDTLTYGITRRWNVSVWSR